MKSLRDYTNPFEAIRQFEQELAEWTGAPYAIVTDCCTHAIEIAFRITGHRRTRFPSRTYLSVLMTMHKLGIQYQLSDLDWYQQGCYQFEDTNIWDSARRLDRDMYQPGTIQCLSFGRTKPLDIGRGGCLLTDDPQIADRANRMRYDGRDIFNFSPWIQQKTFELGFHYYMKPEDAIAGSNLLRAGVFRYQTAELFNYPDCREIEIVS
jgi:dTDP-4-amino-4,6-dideoxygalactose transaminase